MNSKIYCPYTDKLISEAESNNEHIIPLSLGGSNQFTLPVDKQANATLGSTIDGQLANDFLVLFKREEYDARGHSDTAPVPIIRKAKDATSGRPLQVTMGKHLKIWDARDRVEVPLQGQQLNLSVRISMDLPLRFVAKTALSAGYFVYGDLFKTFVRHQDLRLLMKGSRALSKAEIKSVRTKIYDRFQSGLTGQNRTEFEIQKLLCESVKGSCVIFMPGKSNLGICVGALGHYLGMVNVPADTTAFPRFDEHDLGHAIFLIDGVMKRHSYRERIGQLLSLIESQKPNA